MRRLLILGGVLLTVAWATDPALAQDTTRTARRHGIHFVDANGDGYNDNAPDADGDGIPNGLDPDFRGRMKRAAGARGFVDANGDGINDNAPDLDGDGIPNGMDPDFRGGRMHQGRGNGNGPGNGPGGGTGMGPRRPNGSGMGPGAGSGTGPGSCGSGPKGPGQGQGRRN